MSEENLVRQCAPTLAGIKTGTIFPVPFDSLPGLTAEIRDLNRILVPKGLRLLPLRISSAEELGLPPVVVAQADKPRGLVLVTGPTGSGKTMEMMGCGW